MAILVKSEKLGWLSVVDMNRPYGAISSFYWSTDKENAKPYRVGDPELVVIHEELCRLKQQHSMVREYVFWFDRDEEGG